MVAQSVVSRVHQHRSATTTRIILLSSIHFFFVVVSDKTKVFYSSFYSFSFYHDSLVIQRAMMLCTIFFSVCLFVFTKTEPNAYLLFVFTFSLFFFASLKALFCTFLKPVCVSVPVHAIFFSIFLNGKFAWLNVSFFTMLAFYLLPTTSLSSFAKPIRFFYLPVVANHSYARLRWISKRLLNKA